MRTATARTVDRPTVTPTPDIRKLRELAKSQESHTRSCKRPLDGCSTCRDTVRWVTAGYLSRRHWTDTMISCLALVRTVRTVDSSTPVTAD